MLIESWKGSSKRGTFSLIVVLLSLKLLSVNTYAVLLTGITTRGLVKVEFVIVAYVILNRELNTLITSAPESMNNFE
jgi:hypothetical protein